MGWFMSPRASLVLMLLLSSLAQAEPEGLQLYEGGDYEAAIQAFTRVLTAPDSTQKERDLARLYLAASLHAVGQVEQTQQHLEVLAREYPELRMDPVRFLPELVELAESIRARVERERMAREQALRQPPPQQAPAASPAPVVRAVHLRPEAFGLVEALGLLGSQQPTWQLGGGLAYGQGNLEGSARVLLGGSPIFHVQGGVLLGHAAFQPYLGLRAVLVPGEKSYGGGAVVGGRFALPAGFVALVDVGAEYLPNDDDFVRPFALTVQAGLGFDIRLR
ncbi:tetratricopeptide repeat protein [Archangium sp.]|jgi:hypothetical protein|uniref:tetratricopeptide repeat protein n=1 Tax=Archangium sp. TaxID=1872627 RepID=UPI002ED9AD80